MHKILLLFLLLTVKTTHCLAIPFSNNIDTTQYDQLDCNQLYLNVIELEAKTLNHQSTMFTPKNNTIASVTSVFFPPALTFVGVSKAVSLNKNFVAKRKLKELDYLRQRMGQLGCFVK